MEILDLAFDFLREVGPSPAPRAAVLQEISQLDLELVDRTTDGSATFTVVYHDPNWGQTELSFTIDGTGHLRREITTLIGWCINSKRRNCAEPTRTRFMQWASANERRRTFRSPSRS